MEAAPTAFGKVTVHAVSKLSDGYVEMHVTPPPRLATKILLRAPLPAGWHVRSATVDGEPAPLIDDDIVALAGRTKAVVVRFEVHHD